MSARYAREGFEKATKLSTRKQNDLHNAEIPVDTVECVTMARDNTFFFTATEAPCVLQCIVASMMRDILERAKHDAAHSFAWDRADAYDAALCVLRRQLESMGGQAFPLPG